ncbi:MAG: LysE family translocator [Ktedonobacterales bacterium]
MMLAWAFVLGAVGLGIAYAAAPGAVNTEALRRGVTQGARATFLVEAGSLIGDSLWAVLGLTGVALLAHALAVQVVLGIAGGCFLLRMGWLALHEALRRRTSSAAGPLSNRGDFGTGVVFGLANPVGLAFWSGLGTSVVATGARGLAFVVFFLGFFLGAVAWCLSLTVAMRLGRRWVGPRAFRWVNVCCGLILAYFGIEVLWTTAQSWVERHGPSLLDVGRHLAVSGAGARHSG